MPIALRLNFVDVICDDSLRYVYACGKKIGYRFDIRLSYYRGHFLSVIDEFLLKVDGNEINQDSISFGLRGKDYGLAPLHDLVDVFWPITEPATITVLDQGSMEEGEHDIELSMYFRSPYMQIGKDRFMPVDSSGRKKLIIGDSWEIEK